MRDQEDKLAGDSEEVRQLRLNGETALASLFGQHRHRLRRMLQIRMDNRLYGRIDASDVLQDAYLDAAKRLTEYLNSPSTDFYIWIRLLTAQRLVALHRHHLGAKMRDATQEVSLHRGALPQATSLSLAEHLMGRLTSPTKAVVRAELQLRVQQALNEMEAIDREIIALRHFEEFKNDEVAAILEISKAAASNRYVRAMKRLRKIIDGGPDQMI